MFIFNDVIDNHTTAPIEEDYINKEEEEEGASVNGSKTFFPLFFWKKTEKKILPFTLAPSY